MTDRAESSSDFDEHKGGETGEVTLKALRGSFYSVGASVITITLGFLRAVALARLLSPEHFGVFTLAFFYVNLAGSLRGMGFSSAVIHSRKVDEKLRDTFFILEFSLLAGAFIILAALTPVLGRLYPHMPLLGGVTIALALVAFLKGLNGFQETFLNRELAFRRLATANVVASVAMTVAAPLAALKGLGAWSLVIEQAVGQLARGLVCWLRPGVVIPGTKWATHSARWLLKFGSRVWAGSNIVFLIDRFDDFWVGTFLGQTPLGYYSRAYEFARYSRRLIANPLTSVFFPAFARLQQDRLELSRAFYRITSLMVRLGLWFGLLFVFAAREFIVLFLGEKWLPMLTTFRLMAVYTFADPLTVVGGNLLTATGYPGWVTKIRSIQLLIFIPAVFVLGKEWGIEGVALAADLMVAVGAALLFSRARRVVDYSLRAMWTRPLAAMAVAMVTVTAMNSAWGSIPLPLALLGKGALLTGIYGGILWMTEQDQLRAGWQMVRTALPVFQARDWER